MGRRHDEGSEGLKWPEGGRAWGSGGVIKGVLSVGKSPVVTSPEACRSNVKV